MAWAPDLRRVRCADRGGNWAGARPPCSRRRHVAAGGSILIQLHFSAGLTYRLNRRLGVEWCVAGPWALIGASNSFELAVTAAIALFGFQSGATLATVVGVLIEVPAMLSVVHIARRSRGWYERAAP